MRRMIITGVLAVTTVGGAIGAVGALAGNGNGPGPNGHNDFGLCKAMSSGSANGVSHKSSAPPFQALASASPNPCPGTPGGK